MAVLKCTFCGGELEVNADLSVGKCKYCDSIITIPKELDRKGNLYNRAIFLRQNNEFDKAVSAYEDILKEDNSDAEAHWGLVLSKFGIEYVVDPKTQERIPTCHRTQTQSILADPDYLAAIEHSDAETRKVIENEAARINKIQARILEISRNEKPYDIFICYKETDESGNRTEDSVLAQDLYYELTKKGYRVFFARKTIELGKEYEPIIFAALNSAKVMIVLGTKPEHFNAVWVKNEWSRFIHMSKDAHKMIIPAYRGMSPYELPAELSAFQSQDMSKIGFMQDLVDGIERCMHGEVNRKPAPPEPAQAYGTTSLKRLIQNSDTYLKLGNYGAAEEVYTTITRDYPEDYRGWWGLIVCNTRKFSDITIIVSDQIAKQKLSEWFGYVKQLASPEEFENLESQYTKYMREVSLFDADKVADKMADGDMEIVNSKISGYDSEIQNKQKYIKRLEESIKKSEENWKYKDNLHRSEIKNNENSIYANEYMRSEKKKGWMLICLGVIAAFAGIIIFLLCFSIIKDEIYLLVSALSITAGYVLCKVGSKKSEGPPIEEIGIKIAVAKTDIQNAKKALEDDKKNCDREIAAIRSKISGVENEIAALNEKIARCKSYLKLGKDKIYELWFSKACEAFGESKPFDSHIQELRNAAFEISAEDAADTISISCPACGEEIRESISVLEVNGYAVCGNCGHTVQLSESSKEQ